MRSRWGVTAAFAFIALCEEGFAGAESVGPELAEETAAESREDLSPFSLGGLDLVGSSAVPFIRDTRLFIDGRFRYEFGDLEGRKESDALTWRHRVGIETGRWNGFSLLAELEHTWDLLGEDHYNPFPRAGRTVIADPGNVELNRLQLRYANDWLSLTGGRQRITLDDQRFVGNVGWRQNEQTYDAIRFQVSPWEDMTIDYSWIWRVNRIFGEQVPAPVLNHFDSDSDLISVSYTGLPCGTLTGFGYWLDFEEAPALSSQTYGIRFNGSHGVTEEIRWVYDLEWASQSEYKTQGLDYRADFYRVESGLDFGNGWVTGLGYEVLGEDDGVAFQVPLGTNHKFNGFADAFLVTPGTGLQDFYAWVGLPVPCGIKGRLAYHHFLTDTDRTKIGEELDFTLGRPLGEHASLLLKAAFLKGNGAQPDVSRVSLQLDYSF